MENRPKVGVGVYILNNKKQLLLKKRIGTHGFGTWSPGGGHLEFGETIENCAKREVKEEFGISIINIKIIGVTNDIHINEGKHYITIAVIAKCIGKNPKNMEPDIAETIGWFDLDRLPKPLFLPVEHFLKDHQLDKL